MHTVSFPRQPMQNTVSVAERTVYAFRNHWFLNRDVVEYQVLRSLLLWFRILSLHDAQMYEVDWGSPGDLAMHSAHAQRHPLHMFLGKTHACWAMTWIEPWAQHPCLVQLHMGDLSRKLPGLWKGSLQTQVPVANANNMWHFDFSHPQGNKVTAIYTTMLHWQDDAPGLCSLTFFGQLEHSYIDQRCWINGAQLLKCMSCSSICNLEGFSPKEV